MKKDNDRVLPAAGCPLLWDGFLVSWKKMAFVNNMENWELAAPKGLATA